jgi:hypothetical protein
MMQLTPQMRILVSVEPTDFRAGTDGVCRVCRVCRAELSVEPFDGTVFVFRNRSRTAIKLLCASGKQCARLPEARNRPLRARRARRSYGRALHGARRRTRLFYEERPVTRSR